MTVAGKLDVNGDADLSGGNVMTSYHAATASTGVSRFLLEPQCAKSQDQ